MIWINDSIFMQLYSSNAKQNYIFWRRLEKSLRRSNSYYVLLSVGKLERHRLIFLCEWHNIRPSNELDNVKWIERKILKAMIITDVQISIGDKRVGIKFSFDGPTSSRTECGTGNDGRRNNFPLAEWQGRIVLLLDERVEAAQRHLTSRLAWIRNQN